MFGWFKPRCPLDTAWKTWTERRMLWLADRLGVDRLLDAQVVEPTEEFFPDLYDADRASARKCLDRVCGYMGVDPARVTLEVVADDDMPGAAGLYEQRARSNICVAESQLASPDKLLATLAHELAHEVLLGGKLLTHDVADHEQVTDLLPVFLGVGILGANATITDTSGYEGGWSWWSVSRQGYLSSIQLGYALALFAFMRGEVWPEWAGHLRPDAAETLGAGVRYLSRTGDSLFHPDTVRDRRGDKTVMEIVLRLEDASPTFRMDALLDVDERNLADPALLAPVRRCLGDRDGHVRAAAARSAGAFGFRGRVLIPRLVEMLREGEDSARAAAGALVNVGAAPELVVPEFARLMKESPELVDALALSLGSYGAEARAALPALLDAFGRALLGKPGALDALRTALRAISDDPARDVRRHFADDGELLRLALFDLRTEGG